MRYNVGTEREVIKMFNYHMMLQKRTQYLDDCTIKGFIRDIYFKDFKDAYDLLKKYEGDTIYNIRISNTRTLLIKNEKNKELGGKRFLPAGILIELYEGKIIDYR